MKEGNKVKINDDAFKGLVHYNGMTGKITGKGKSGDTFAVALPNGGCAYVEEKNLTIVE